MAADESSARSIPGILHQIPPNLTAFEPSTSSKSDDTTNSIVWIGGLCDTLFSVKYPLEISKQLPPTWSLVVASLSSSGLQFGISSIAQDVEDISVIISYLKNIRPRGKIAIMGHSTGCQDCVSYLTGSGRESRPKIDAIILQAPVSDREAFEMMLPKEDLLEVNRIAREQSRNGRADEVLENRLTKSIFGKAPVTAKRWLDLASPPPDHNGADDMFSSDLHDDQLASTFGRTPAGVPWLFLYSGNDEAVPKFVDKPALLSRWAKFVLKAGGIVDQSNGGVIPGATHNYNGCPDEVIQDLVARVVKFVSTIK